MMCYKVVQIVAGVAEHYQRTSDIALDQSLNLDEHVVVVAGLTEHCKRMSDVALDQSLNLDEHLCMTSDMVN